MMLLQGVVWHSFGENMNKHLFILDRESIRDKIKVINKVLTHRLTIFFIGALWMLVRGQLQKEKWLKDMKITRSPPQHEWWLMKAGNLKSMVLSTEEHLNREEGLSLLQLFQTSSRHLIMSESLQESLLPLFPSFPLSFSLSFPSSLSLCVCGLTGLSLSFFYPYNFYMLQKNEV